MRWSFVFLALTHQFMFISDDIANDKWGLIEVWDSYTGCQMSEYSQSMHPIFFKRIPKQ